MSHPYMLELTPHQITHSFKQKQDEFERKLETLYDCKEADYPDGGRYVGQMRN